MAFWLHFRILGDLVGGSWGILARSWAILGDLGVKMGPCWQHVGTKMAKMSQDRRTWEKMGGFGQRGTVMLVASGRASGGA